MGDRVCASSFRCPVLKEGSQKFQVTREIGFKAEPLGKRAEKLVHQTEPSLFGISDRAIYN